MMQYFLVNNLRRNVSSVRVCVVTFIEGLSGSTICLVWLKKSGKKNHL